MTSPRHFLVLGGNGRISRVLTRELLEKSWSVTSLIRKEEQIEDLRKIGDRLPGKLGFIVRDLIDVSSQEKAQAIIDEVKPTAIFWSAGAGAEGDQDRVLRIDRDAASYFARAAAATPSITHYVLVSYLGARRRNAPWWTAEDWEGWKKVNSTFLARYYEAKVAADEALFTAAKQRDDIAMISVRPGGLTDGDAGGVIMGQTKKARGMTTRATTARVASLLLQSDNVTTRWLDVLDGDDDVEEEVHRCVRDGVECAVGEPVYTK